MIFKYDRGNGDYPHLNDKVTLAHLNFYLDGREGTIVGWGDAGKISAIVLLDDYLVTGEKAVVLPVVCLIKKTFTR